MEQPSFIASHDKTWSRSPSVCACNSFHGALATLAGGKIVVVVSRARFLYAVLHCISSFGTSEKVIFSWIWVFQREKIFDAIIEGPVRSEFVRESSERSLQKVSCAKESLLDEAKIFWFCCVSKKEKKTRCPLICDKIVMVVNISTWIEPVLLPSENQVFAESKKIKMRCRLNSG